MQNPIAAAAAGAPCADAREPSPPALVADAVAHRRLVRALVVACIAAGSWLALHDGTASFDALNAPVERATFVR